MPSSGGHPGARRNSNLRERNSKIDILSIGSVESTKQSTSVERYSRGGGRGGVLMKQQEEDAIVQSLLNHSLENATSLNLSTRQSGSRIRIGSQASTTLNVCSSKSSSRRVAYSIGGALDMLPLLNGNLDNSKVIQQTRLMPVSGLHHENFRQYQSVKIINKSSQSKVLGGQRHHQHHHHHHHSNENNLYILFSEKQHINL